MVAPRILRPNRDYHVVVSTHGTAKPVKVNVEVGGQQDSGGVILNRQLADLQPDSSQVLNFQVSFIGRLSLESVRNEMRECKSLAGRCMALRQHSLLCRIAICVHIPHAYHSCTIPYFWCVFLAFLQALILMGNW